MSLIVHDLRCPDGHYEVSVYFPRGAPTPCPICSKPRTVFYATREMAQQEVLQYADPTVAVFRPISVGGATYHTKEAYDRYLADFARKHKTTADKLGIESAGTPNQRAVRRDELRHAAWEKRKEEGFDTQRFEGYQEEQRRINPARDRR